MIAKRLAFRVVRLVRAIPGFWQVAAEDARAASDVRLVSSSDAKRRVEATLVEPVRA